MFTRFLIVIASLTVALGQVLPGDPIPLPISKGNPCDCCAKKPQYVDSTTAPPPFSWALFTGPIAVITHTEDIFVQNTTPWKNQVVMIWNLTNQGTAPLNTWWHETSPSPSQPYSNPDWTVAKLGEVFGLTLDNAGNIYVAASRVYGNNNLGSLSTGIGNARAGQIYKLLNGSGTPTPFSLLPQGPSGEGLGNIYYDCGFSSLYASDFFDGLIYRINAAGTIQPNPWDHGLNLPTAVGPTGIPLGRSAILGQDLPSSYAALGRRTFAVRVYKRRLWYSVWTDNFGRFTGNPGNPTEVWSVALNVNGDPMPPARLEITLPQMPPQSPATQPFTNPVSDISFGPMGTLMVAEKMMIANNAVSAHQARALEYSWNGVGWVLPNPTAYTVGGGTNSSGGVDFDFSPGGRVWVSADALHMATNDNIYGIQGFPAGGGTTLNSILIDSNDYIIDQDKYFIGDVKISCPDCASPPIPPVIVGPQSTCVSPGHYTITPQTGVTYSWTVTGGTPSTTTGPAIDVTWSGTGAGTVTVTASGLLGCGSVSSSLSAQACAINCEFCKEYQTSVSMHNPIDLGGGLESLTPNVFSNMPGVTSVTTTLLSTSVGYSTASCGVPGPLGAYIPLASASSIPALNPPMLPVPNGNQAIWHSSSTVSLSGGALTPFQLQLPPPPVFTNSDCHASFSFCLRVSLANSDCRNCDLIRCFGPFPYEKKSVLTGGGGGASDLPHVVQFILPDRGSIAVQEGSFLIPLLTFLQESKNITVPQRFVIDNLNFESGKAVVTESSIPVLNNLATVLKAYPSTGVRLEGYSDNSGDAVANPRLSLERVEAVRAVLQRAGVPASRITVEGLGAKNPIASNNTEEGRTKNRRIELVVLHR